MADVEFNSISQISTLDPEHLFPVFKKTLNQPTVPSVISQADLLALFAANGGVGGAALGKWTRSILEFKTGGAGTYASPYTGWEAPLRAYIDSIKGNCTILFPSGVYLDQVGFKWAKYSNTAYLAERGTILMSTQSTIASFVGEIVNVQPGWKHSYGIIFTGFILDGGNSANSAFANKGMYLGAVHHSIFRVEVRNVLQAAFEFGFSVCNDFDIRTTNRIGNRTGDDFSTPEPVNKPSNGLLVHGVDPNGASSPFFQCNDVFMIIETTSGAGSILGNAHHNRFFGTSEATAGTSMIVNSTSDNNTVTGMDFEVSGNSVNLDCAGSNNKFVNCTCPDGVAKITGGRANKIEGGMYNTLQIDSAASYTRVDTPTVGRSGGSFIDNSATTEIIGQIQRYNAGVEAPTRSLKMPSGASFGGDVTLSSGGLVLTSPNGSQKRLILNDDGTISWVAIANLTNYALATAGATVTGTNPINGNYSLASLINGVRHTNNGWGIAANGYASTVGMPVNVDITFSQSRTITEIDVFTLADATNYNVDPTLSDTFSTSNGVTAFDVQYWNGTTWVTITSVTGNNKVWRKFTFAAVTTTKIRINVTASSDNIARLVEVEAWG